MIKIKRQTAKKITFVIFIVLLIISTIFLKAILKPIVFSILIAYLLNPFVKFMTSKGMNKRLAALICLAVLFGIAALIVFFIIPGIMKDVLGVISNMGEYTEKLTNYFSSSGYSDMPKYLKDILDKNIGRVQNVSTDYLNGFFNQIIDFSMELPTYILTPVFIYYFLIDVEFFKDFIKSFIPLRARSKAMELGREMDKIMGGFIRSQLILSIVISVLTFIILIVMKIKYPIMIAFINGLTNIIPYFGPIIGLIPAFLAALTESVDKAIIVAVAFLIAQQFESAVIAPKVMGESIGIHPVFVMLVLLIGGKFFGGWGLIFSIPVAGMIKVTWNYIIRNLY